MYTYTRTHTQTHIFSKATEATPWIHWTISCQPVSALVIILIVLSANNVKNLAHTKQVFLLC